MGYRGEPETSLSTQLLHKSQRLLYRMSLQSYQKSPIERMGSRSSLVIRFDRPRGRPRVGPPSVGIRSGSQGAGNTFRDRRRHRARHQPGGKKPVHAQGRPGLIWILDSRLVACLRRPTCPLMSVSSREFVAIVRPPVAHRVLDVPAERLARVIGSWPEPALLESGPGFGASGRWSILAARPRLVFEATGSDWSLRSDSGSGDSGTGDVAGSAGSTCSGSTAWPTRARCPAPTFHRSRGE